MGIWTTVPATELVAGDIVKLSLGTVVVADVHLIDGSVLLDQSMLTGESIPAETGAGAQAYAGALVRRGEAVAEVTATGERTRFGRTAELVRTAKVESSQQKIVMGVVRNLAPVQRRRHHPACFLCVFFAAAGCGDRAARPGGTSLVDPRRAAIYVHAGPRRSVHAHSRPRTCCRRAFPRSTKRPVSTFCARTRQAQLTRNELAVMSVCPMPGFDEAHVLALRSFGEFGWWARSGRCRHSQLCHAQKRC